jgi:Ca2+-dependent lipid-binding protein
MPKLGLGLEGRLKVKVMQGRNLMALDIGKTSNPFCTLVIQSLDGRPVGAKQKTAVRSKTLSPVWNEEFEWAVGANVAQLVLHMWDHDFVGKNEYALWPVFLQSL